MIDYIIHHLLESLPLKIETVSWDGDVLTLSGLDWSFSTLSAWRVLNTSSIEYACWDRNIEAKVQALAHQMIVGATEQGSIMAVDPVFQLSNGQSLEIFSSETFEPWTLKLPNGQIFSGALVGALA